MSFSKIVSFFYLFFLLWCLFLFLFKNTDLFSFSQYQGSRITGKINTDRHITHVMICLQQTNINVQNDQILEIRSATSHIMIDFRQWMNLENETSLHSNLEWWKQADYRKANKIIYSDGKYTSRAPIITENHILRGSTSFWDQIYYTIL